MVGEVFPPAANATLDIEGRLTDADPRLAELNERAGGAIGQVLAVPQLATLARLARRLGVLIARGVVVADGPDELELWARAEPADGGVRLAVTGWTQRAGWRPPPDPGRETALIRADSDWSWRANAALSVTDIEPEGSRRHGVDLSGALGQPLTQLFSLAENGAGDLPMFSALGLRRGFAGQPATLRATAEPVLLSAAPLTDRFGAFAGYVGAVEIVPAPPPPRLPDRFGAELERALRAPLGRIVASADRIHAEADGPIRADYRDYAADIAGAGRHLLGLVDDLLDLQAIERNDYRPLREPIDLADLGRRAAGLLTVRAAEHRVRIDRPAEDESVPATGEFRRALQIMVNLLSNAIRYSPEGAMIWVRTWHDEDRAAIVVADQGRGIAPADQLRIFEKFERLDPGEPGGSGLGLYIARKLAHAMGGDLTVDSAPGQGARFTLTLPARA